MSNNKTVIVKLDQSRAKTFTMPAGYETNVDIYCWGAGGGTGWGGAPGGGGGFAKTTATVASGDKIRLQIGLPGLNAPSATVGGSGGVDSSFTAYRGGNGGGRGYWCGNVNGPYPSGGGGGASWVSINGYYVCVAAGGGGGGGYGHEGYKVAGYPGGVYPGSATSVYPVSYGTWSSLLNTYGVWGGGQDYTTTVNFPVDGTYTFRYSVDNYGTFYLDGSPVISRSGEYNYTSIYTATVYVTAGDHTVRVTGYNISGPAGVAAQILTPDSSNLWNTRALTITSGLTNTGQGGNASWGGGGGGGYRGGQSGYASGHAVTGGNGGLNYGTVTEAGSGTLGGGRSSPFYPGFSIGQASNEGYVVLVLTKKLNFYVKSPDGLGAWTNIISTYVKIPTQTIVVNKVDPPATIAVESISSSTWTVPNYVTSITIRGCGGGGSGGSGDGGKNNDGPGYGGGGSNLKSQVFNVVPGQVLTVSVGAGGKGGYGLGGKAGFPSTVTGPGINFSAAGGGGGGSHPGWGPTGEISPGVRAGSYGGGAGANGATSGGYPGAGVSTNGGANGGKGGPHNMQAGGNGQNGKLSISYTPIPYTVNQVIGGWKSIQNIYVKVNGAWKPIETSGTITLYNL